MALRLVDLEPGGLGAGLELLIFFEKLHWSPSGLFRAETSS